MPRGRSAEDLSTLQMALVGYQMERQKIDDKIRQIEARLGGKQAGFAAPAGQPRTKSAKRVLSPDARKRIAAAQRKRWAEHRKKASAAKSE